MYFKENQFMTLQRTELYGSADLLAKCGGLMGLCLGISVISLVEIVYYSVIRFWFFLPRNEVKTRDSTTNPEKVQDTKSFWKIAQNLVCDYFTKATIQGIKYVVDVDLTRIERIWWTVVFALSFVSCGSFIFDMLKRYDHSPVIISFENSETSILKVQEYDRFLFLGCGSF
jgi:Amiloride-sensitive sodium channel